MWAVIGGSGFEKFDNFAMIERLDTHTPFGEASSGLCIAELEGFKFLFLSRHGLNHEQLPSQINHKANIYALKKFGAKGVISFSAVGSLREDLAPGDLVVPDQYIDRTKKGLDKTSFFGDKLMGNAVGHLSMGDPIDLKIFPILKDIINSESNADFKAHFNRTYICMEGPNFSTRAESKMYQIWGADIIGMTNFPEYALAAEANLLYVPMCFVTDYDSWRVEEAPVTLEQVIALMRQNNKKAFSLIAPIFKSEALNKLKENHKSGLPSGMMSPVDQLDKEQKYILKVLS